MTQLSVGQNAPTIDARPLFGLPVRTPGAAGGRQPLAVVFLRSLGGGNARAAVRALNAAYARFDAAGVQVVGISRTDLVIARDFVPRYHVLFPVIADEDGALSASWSIGRDRGLVRSLIGVLTRPDALANAASAAWEGRSAPEHLDQLPAEFVVGVDGRLRHVRYGTTVWDQPDIEALWEASTRA
jgi:peroxiredoxin